MPSNKILTKSNGYSTLVKKSSRELSDLETFIKRRTAEGYWRIGKYIHEHLLANQARAQYGVTLYERLARDVDRELYHASARRSVFSHLPNSRRTARIELGALYKTGLTNVSIMVHL